MQIHQLKKGSKKGKKRIGRGGKKGTYSGKGMKGQKSRTGYSKRATFEGGKSTLVIHTKKKRGFKSVGQKKQIVNLSQIELKFKAGETVEPKILQEKNLIKNAKDGVKILSEGDLKKKLNFENVSLSKKAKEKIEAAGGSVK